MVGSLVSGLQRLLFGRLRAVETEQLYEKAWFAVTETCLAMTVFRGEMGGWFLVMFVCLLIGKLWGWIGQGRLEVLEQQPPSNPRLFHTRLAISLLISVLFNASLLDYAVKTVLRQARPDMMVMFAFEFAVLTIMSLSTVARYVISVTELFVVRQQKRIKIAERREELRVARAETMNSDGSGEAANMSPDEEIDEMELDVPGWEEKARWVLYLDLLTGKSPATWVSVILNLGANQGVDFFKLVVYLCFFAILFTFYGLPIHILRDVVLTMKSFIKRILHFVRYRNATRDMNERYPDATAEEISREDVCIICREEMHPWRQPGAANGQTPRIVSERLRPKKLPCGHLLHFACLRSWLERQQNCPTCRRPVAPAGGNHQGNAQAGAAPNGRGHAGVPGQQPNLALNQADGAHAEGPGEARPRAWFLNLGPVRIGFGAGRGDIVQNLVQQMQQDGQPGHGGPAPNPNPAPVEAPQPLGFSFGFGRRPAQTQFNHQDVQLQLLQLEQQILQEINGLMATAEQLNVVRLLQGELARLRAGHANQNQAQATTTTNTNAHVPTTTLSPTPTLFTSHTPGPTQHRFSSHSQPMLQAGDARLPEGLTLPPGWTIVPLQRVAQGAPQAGQSTGSVPNFTTGGPNPFTRPQRRRSSLDSPSVSRLFPSASSTTPIEPPSDSVIAQNTTTSSSSGPPVPNNETSRTFSSSTQSRTPPIVNDNKSTLPTGQDNLAGENGRASETSKSDSNNESLGSEDNEDQQESSSSSKGKARAATVEDADEE